MSTAVQGLIIFLLPGKMATRHGNKRGAQSINNSLTYTPSKPVKAKNTKLNDTKEVKDEEEDLDVKGMFEMIMTKLGKLDIIEKRMEIFETELKEVKDSIEFAHSELHDLKKECKKIDKSEEESKQRLDNLEQKNTFLNNRVIDLQARSMRDNLIFYNIKENDGENTTEVIHSLLESHFGIENAKAVKIDRSHRMGRKLQHARKPRAIIAKFNYFQDKQKVLTNARKLKGTGIAVSEQFPEEIMIARKRLYPELKKAREEGKRVKLVRDKLYIDGQLFRESGFTR